MAKIEYIVVRSTPPLAVKREEFHEHVVNSEKFYNPQIMLVDENLEDIASYLVELLVGLGSVIYEQNVSPILNSPEPSSNIKYRIKMYHKMVSGKGLL